MAQIAPVTVKDGKATPADHLFTPIKSGEISLWRETIPTLPLIGQGTLNLSVRSAVNGVAKVRAVVELPVLEAIVNANAAGYTAAPKQAYSNKVVIEFFAPVRGTDTQRKDLRLIVSNLLLNQQIADSIDLLTAPY